MPIYTDRTETEFPLQDCKILLPSSFSGVQWTTFMCHTAFIHPFSDILHHGAQVESLLESSDLHLARQGSLLRTDSTAALNCTTAVKSQTDYDTDHETTQGCWGLFGFIDVSAVISTCSFTTICSHRMVCCSPAADSSLHHYAAATLYSVYWHSYRRKSERALLSSLSEYHTF